MATTASATAKPLEQRRSPALERVRSALPEPLRGRVRSGRELGREQRRPQKAPLPITLEPLARLLDGGLPRGRLVELVGRRSCGRFSSVLEVLAAATRAGEAAALVDLGDGLDPGTTAGAGVELERLLWLRPRHLREALAAAEIVLSSGFPCVVVDLGPAPVAGGRGVEGAWLRLARLASEREAVLLVASPYRVSGTAATTVLAARPARCTWSRSAGSRDRLAPLLTGLDAHLERQKHRGTIPGGEGTLAFQIASPRVEAEPPGPRAQHPLPAAAAGSPAAVATAG